MKARCRRQLVSLRFLSPLSGERSCALFVSVFLFVVASMAGCESSAATVRTARPDISPEAVVPASNSFTGGLGGCQLFVLAGQSNMAGWVQVDQLSPEEMSLPQNVTLQEAVFDLHGRRIKDRLGPEVGLARVMAPLFPDQRLVFVKYAVEGSSLLAWTPDWSPEAAASTGNAELGSLYPLLMDQIETAQTALPGACPVVAVFWMQGERDARFPAAAAAYEENLSRLIDALRDDLGASALSFFLGSVDPPPEQYPAVDVVRQAQSHIADRTPQVWLVSTDGLSKHPDSVHFDLAGQLELGRRFAHAYLDAMRLCLD